MTALSPTSCKIELRLKPRAHVAGWTAKELPAALAASSPAAAASQPDRPGCVKKQCPRADPAPLHAMARHLQGCALLQASLPSQVCCVAPVGRAAHLLVLGPHQMHAGLVSQLSIPAWDCQV